MEAWLRAERESPANPASPHRSGRRAQAVLEDARDRAAAALRCTAREVVFTSGATEANNLALFGAARALRRMHGVLPRLIASAAEHPAVLAPLRVLQNEGYPLQLVPLDACARAEVAAMEEQARGAEAALVALQWANNETGAVQDVARAVALTGAGTHVHVDAVQGFGKLPWSDALEAASTFAVSGHKLGAPKGIGVLRVADGVALDPLLVGGGQQRGRRAGTEPPALAAAFACALELALAEQPAFAAQTRAHCDLFLALVRARGLRFTANHPADAGARLPNTLSLTLHGVDGRALLPACDVEGLDLASGAACSSGAALPSAVLLACGLPESLARATVRVSLGPNLEATAMHEAAERFVRAARRLYEVADR
jgi:cysteine desulfurase